MSANLSRRNALASLGMLGLVNLPEAHAQTSTKPKSKSPVIRSGKPKLAVVLGSGSARGFAHIGVIKALENAKIKPDIIVGTSAGALVGGLWAAGYTGLQLEQLAMKIKDADIIDFDAASKRGLVGGAQIEQLINQLAHNKTIEQLPTKFACVTTAARTGEMVVMQDGDLGFAVRASCSIPGVFLPAKRNDIEYIDGGLISPLPVQVARQLGADWVVAVDVNSSGISSTPNGIFEQIMHSFDIMGRALSRIESEQADIVIRPDLTRIAGTDFTARNVTIQLGLVAGQRMIPVIQEQINQQNKKGHA